MRAGERQRAKGGKRGREHERLDGCDGKTPCTELLYRGDRMISRGRRFACFASSANAHPPGREHIQCKAVWQFCDFGARTSRSSGAGRAQTCQRRGRSRTPRAAPPTPEVPAIMCDAELRMTANMQRR
eukprot:6185550-Pleurochrysis_carterae.AAC.1